MEQQEINPQDTTRAKAFELWMNVPNPMVTLFKKINMLLCWCIGRLS